MARLGGMLAAFAIGSAILSRPAVAQQSSSVSLMHTVTVTVPSRVKVQVAQVAPASQKTVRILAGQAAPDGLSLSISATQGWTLSIGANPGRSRQQWSLDRNSGFAPLTTRNSTVVSGAQSQVPTTATVFFRSSNCGSSADDRTATDSGPLMLTIVAP